MYLSCKLLLCHLSHQFAIFSLWEGCVRLGVLRGTLRDLESCQAPDPALTSGLAVSLLQSHLYLLVTDQGFLQEEQVVWESLHNVDGDSCFCDSDFHLSHSLGKSHGAEGGSGSPEKQLQVDQVCGPLGTAQRPLAWKLFAYK